jgi:adenylate cyclase
MLLMVWVFCIALTLHAPPLITAVDQNVRDHFLRLATSDQPDPRIAVIDLDETSLARIAPWPWTRSQVADLVEKTLLDEDAASIGLDIIFPQAGDPQGDARLAALGKVAPITFAYVLDYTTRGQPLDAGVLPIHAAQALLPNAAGLPTAKGYMSNHLGLQDVRCAGNIGYIPDADGVIRTIPLVTEYQSQQYYSLSHALLTCAGLQLPFPSTTFTPWKLPFHHSESSLLVVSAADVLQGKLPEGLLKDRHVLLGSSSLALGDHVSTPLNPLTAGVLVHAAALAGLLDYRSGLYPISQNLPAVAVIWLSLSFLVLTQTLRACSPLINMLLLAAFSAFWVLVAYTNVTMWYIEHPISATLSGYALVAILVFPLEWWITRKKEHALLKNLSSYVGKPILQELVRHGLQRSLSPSLREITVIVVDMQGYTRRIMDLSLPDAAKFTRDFLEVLTEPVINNQGTLDKYTGDGLVAFWGAPLACDNHADLAVTCALDMLKKLHQFSKNSDYKHPLNIRIGIETGAALVGDLGTSFRSSYTAVGDCINLASRLEALAKTFDVPILIGPRTHSELLKHSAKSLGKHPVRDTQTELEVFTIR